MAPTSSIDAAISLIADDVSSAAAARSVALFDDAANRSRYLLDRRGGFGMEDVSDLRVAC